jgi:hypothetical protein
MTVTLSSYPTACARLVPPALSLIVTPEVLIAEASPDFGPGFQKVIRKMPRPGRDPNALLPLRKKCSACWITGVTSIDPLIGLDVRGRSVLLNLEQCRLVLVDGQIESEITGVDLVKALRDSGKFCVGITMWSKLNQELKAPVSVEKPVLFAALANGSITLDEILQGQEKPKELARKFKLFKARYHADKRFRKPAEHILRPKSARLANKRGGETRR